MALVTMRPHRLRYRLTAAAALLSFVSCLTITSSEVAAQDDSDESACRKVLGHDSACCDKLEWLLEFPNASTSDCLPGGGTVLECMVLATAKSLPYDVGLYNMCQNTVSVNVSGTYFLVRTRRQSARNAREACHDVFQSTPRVFLREISQAATPTLRIIFQAQVSYQNDAGRTTAEFGICLPDRCSEGDVSLLLTRGLVRAQALAEEAQIC